MPAIDAVDDKNTSASGSILLVGGKDACEFRKLEIKELKTETAAPLPPAGFVPLFDDKLSAWKPNSSWLFQNGLVTGNSADPPALQTTRADYKDFHLRFDARIKTTALIRFRWPANSEPPFFYGLGFGTPGAKPGKTILTRELPNGPKATASQRINGLIDFPVGAWIKVEIQAEENRFRVFLDEKPAYSFVDDKNTSRSGAILLSCGRDKCEFRKMEIKELAAP